MDAMVGRAARESVPGLFGMGRRVEAGPGFCAALLLGYALLIAVRIPNIWIEGRLWAEEGSVYFAHSWHENWYDALFALHSGYLNVAASLATLLAARLVPLEAVPYATSGFSLLLQLVPAILLTTSGVGWLRDRYALVLALLLLLLPFGAREIWLNSITSQFHLVLGAILILAFPLRGGWVGGFRLVVLVLATLSGPATAFLLPLFVLRAWTERSRGRAWQVLAVGSMAALQLFLIVLHSDAGRELGIGPRLLALVIYQKHVVLPLFGVEHTGRIIGDLAGRVRGGATLWAQMAIGVGASALMTWVVVASRNATIQWLFAGGAIVMVMSYFGALGDHFGLLGIGYGDRYAYAPTASFSLVLLAVAHTAPSWRQRIAMVMVVWMICIGMNEYTLVDPYFAKGSSWSTEVARWRADHGYSLALWPNGWHLPLRANP